ncbi:Ctf8p and Ctf18p associating protein [Massospora cicadina]|nr:Ctf8p and Ctf18p associating protein [Massospora cicadina]
MVAEANMVDTIPLNFTEKISSGDHFKLVEIPPELLSTFKSLCSPCEGSEGKKRLYIKGRPEDEAVLCSEDTTYGLKNVQTSNCLLISQLVKGIDVIHNLKSTIEMSRVAPKLHRVKELLLPSSYRGTMEKYLQKSKTKFYTLEELRAEVQASDSELDAMLQRLRVLKLDGVLRLVDLDDLYQAISLVLECACAFNLNLDELSVEELLVRLSDHEVAPTLISHTVYSVSELLQSLLSRELPETYKPRLEYLEAAMGLSTSTKLLVDGLTSIFDKGLYYLDKDEPMDAFDMNYIHYLSAIDMPFDPKLRFQELFMHKPRWSISEIRPFVMDLVPSRDSNDLNALLLKFCRLVTIREKQFFTCKIKF